MKPSERIKQLKRHFEILVGMDDVSSSINAIVEYLDEEDKKWPMRTVEVVQTNPKE